MLSNYLHPDFIKKNEQLSSPIGLIIIFCHMADNDNQLSSAIWLIMIINYLLPYA